MISLISLFILKISYKVDQKTILNLIHLFEKLKKILLIDAKSQTLLEQLLNSNQEGII
jgi:hypothetical protein